MEQSVLKCPKCGTAIDLPKLLSEAQRRDLADQQTALRQDMEQLLAREKALLAKRMEEEKAGAIAAAEKQAKELLEQRVKNAVVKERLALENERAKDEAARLEMERRLQDAKLESERLVHEQERQVEKARRQARELVEEQARKLNEDFEKERSQLRKQLDRVQSAALTSVSQEVQGEAQEDAVLSALSAWFPHDGFQEVKKGHAGADIVQTVHDVAGIPLGTVVYEVKNTKSFSGEWSAKLRQDMVTAGAALGVLVSEAMPASAPKHGYLGIEKDTLFVCRPADLPVVARMVRELVKATAKGRAVKAGLADFKEQVWQTVNSDRFKQTIIALDGYFKQMKQELERHHKHNVLYHKRQSKRLDLLVAGLLEIEADFGVRLPDASARPLLEDSDEEGDEA